ncbi:2,3-diaminopropionate biosynthesis protein SbnA [Streptomyces sp. SID10815]|uniref:2,3-diaminopropionate biosynthesis protein SbnA n=1 Tax=Streptomyces sp. SID10815 TaxID=2706027 RepID=UPI0013C5B4F7|nr:2,3-diaminopropionate biosynthesis protein SbnA [Streptomyces sp. SID10815]NEA51866.1 2,3-diaminopropionate biosynthesis protein SbnA [Streptomyces sp. SID10815]QKW28604.1 2,3-diaminopropionate biosynthesis protein SbnA [Streptomyces seoulensis]
MTGRVLHGILDGVGDTPLVELTGLLPRLGSRVFAKLESHNPGGSVKDRSALSMLLGRIRGGHLVPGRSTVVESSSGNLAIGLAQICRYFGIDLVCVVDPKTTEQNLAVLRAYGVTVDMVTEVDPETKAYLPARIKRVRELLATLPGAYWPNQYANPLNPLAHERTMAEIAQALDGRVDYLFCSTGTGGTLTGCARHIRAHGLSTTLVGVDALGSVLFGGVSAPRLLPGHGAAVRPALFDPTLADEVVHVSDLESVVACRTLIAREAILAGGSSGAVTAALGKFAARIPAGRNVVLVFPDRGDRYLDTIYSDDWVRAHFGEVSHLWQDPELLWQDPELTPAVGTC